MFCLCKNRLKQNNTRLLIVLLGASLVISLFYGLYNWAGLIPLKEKLPILAAFQFERFHWLHPFLWYLIFALTLAVICKGKHGKRIVILLIVLQLLYSQVIQPFFSQRLGVFHSQVMANETRMNVKVIASIMSGRKAGYISYSRFFSKGLFREIGEFIGLDKKNYRVVSIGVFPSIAQYNGFYTLDSYQFNYPIEYKHKFRRIIEKELGKSEKWRRNFDEWGSRCYVFVAELEDEGFLIGKDRDVKVEKLELNTAALKEMGGEYVFSAVEILNANDTGLTLLKVFEREDSPWRIYLYSVD